MRKKISRYYVVHFEIIRCLVMTSYTLENTEEIKCIPHAIILKFTEVHFYSYEFS